MSRFEFENALLNKIDYLTYLVYREEPSQFYNKQYLFVVGMIAQFMKKDEKVYEIINQMINELIDEAESKGGKKCLNL